MPQTTRTIPGLSNGISLQPPILRSPDQTDDEVNTWGDIAVGLTRRPPTKHVKDLGVTSISDAFIHHINRDPSNRYVVVVIGGQIRVFDDATGVEKTVTAPFGWGYLTGASRADLRAVTVADYTFIVNAQKVVAMGAAKADQSAPPAYHYPGGYLPQGAGVSL